MRTCVLVASLLLAASPSAFAQAADGRQVPGAGDQVAPITPGEVQRMFDAWALVQAQDALNLSEAQYGHFVTKLKALQDARRRHQQAHAQILADLRRALNGPSPSEAALRDKLKALHDEDDRGVAEIQKAADEVDQALDIQQQARFRLFEERMEARKLELLIKARQNVRQGRGK
ncbi:MAG TPA: hypothetical protein VNR64_11010 [Vicinamibacterales bacterium]|nr:hypothetical protein [Vicinamibacterales bacterium]